MIDIFLEGHEMKQDLKELFRMFFPDKEIRYIEAIEQHKGKGILIRNGIYNKNKKIYARTDLYIDNTLVTSSVEDIESIQVHRDSLKKNINVGIKKTLLNVLGDGGSNLPWGILTGIRPVKIIHDLMDKKIDYKEILSVMMEEYRLDLDKAELIIKIAKKQRQHIYPIDKKRYSLYISIPFCPSRCLYCSFPSLPISKYEERIKEYIDILIYEIHKTSQMMEWRDLNTVYIGGGTPTSIPILELDRVIQSVYDNFGQENIREFTVEAGRPDTITADYLKMLNRNKVDRISINPQTMNDKSLKLIGRNHSSKEIIDSFKMARDIGFKSINMDLIIGLPGEGLKEIKRSLEEVGNLDPENLTVHTLSVKRGSRFKDRIEEYSMEKQNTLMAMLEETMGFARRTGLEPYYLYRQKQTLGNLENIGYAKPSRECIYNISMMEEKETIVGVGMGAVSKIFIPSSNRIKRLPNFKGLDDYILRINELLGKRQGVLDSLDIE